MRLVRTLGIALLLVAIAGWMPDGSSLQMSDKPCPEGWTAEVAGAGTYECTPP